MTPAVVKAIGEAAAIGQMVKGSIHLLRMKLFKVGRHSFCQSIFKLAVVKGGLFWAAAKGGGNRLYIPNIYIVFLSYAKRN